MEEGIEILGLLVDLPEHRRQTLLRRAVQVHEVDVHDDGVHRVTGPERRT